jgi:NADH dehydrogenase
MEAAKKRIIIAGAGFGGVRLAWQLRKSNYEVILIDKHNYSQFQPLMYQVATARLEPSSISFPLRKIFQHTRNIQIRVAEVQKVGPEEKILYTSIGPLSYDYLVIAFGCTTNYFGNKRVEQYAVPMKAVPEAMLLRNRILQTFEDALVAQPGELEALLNFVIVGGGPTGVELAGALAEMKKFILPKDYPDKDFSQLTVWLLEGSPHTLNVMSDVSRKKSQEYLEALGVKVLLHTVVEDYDGLTVHLKGGNTLLSRNLIWTAGVIGNTLEGIPKECMVRGNRLKVDRYNEVEGLSGIYAIGDIASMITPKYPNGHPQLANVALTQAGLLAKNFNRLPDNQPLTEYEYTDKGSMATVGKHKAVADLPGIKFQGRFAWFIWMFVHLMLILNTKNKLSILIDWMMSYFTNDSTLRLMLITDNSKIKPGNAASVSS